jgi:hypothetical protein
VGTILPDRGLIVWLKNEWRAASALGSDSSGYRSTDRRPAGTVGDAVHVVRLQLRTGRMFAIPIG